DGQRPILARSDPAGRVTQAAQPRHRCRASAHQSGPWITAACPLMGQPFRETRPGGRPAHRRQGARGGSAPRYCAVSTDCSGFWHALCSALPITVCSEWRELMKGEITTTYRKTLVVVGNGMVGHHCVEQLVQLGALSRYDIHVFGEEGQRAYDRVHLSEYFGGRDAESLALGEADLYQDRKSTRLNSSHVKISYAVFCLKKKI